MTVKPKRAAIPDDLRDLYKRVRILEAVPRGISSGDVFETYRECVAADPTTVNFWPCNDASGDLTDIVGGDDMVVFPFVHNGTWPQYGKTGPFPALPAQTAVENGGGDFTAVNASQSRFLGPPMPSGTSSFTLQGWIYLEDIDYGGFVVTSPQIGMSVSSVTGAIAVSRGAVSLTGAAAAEHVWTHIRLDYNGTTLRLFQDFVLVDSDSAGSVAAGGNMEFLNVPTGSINWGPFVGRAALWSLHDGVASTCDPSGSGGTSDAPEFYVPRSDGSGGVIWDPQTIEVDYSLVDRFSRLTLGAGLTGTDLGGGELSIASSGATGAAGGVLSGTYPNPGFAADMATQAELDAHITDPSGAHAASAVSVADAGGYFDASEVEAALQELGAGGTGVWEIVMQDGVTAPPVPVETEAQDDWIYAWVAD